MGKNTMPGSGALTTTSAVHGIFKTNENPCEAMRAWSIRGIVRYKLFRSLFLYLS